MSVKHETASSWSLVVANLVLIFGVLFFDWSPFLVLISFWLESAVIGFFNIIKMIMARKTPVMSPNAPVKKTVMTDKQSLKIVLFFTVPFFIFHYGVFMFAHLVFISVFYGLSTGGMNYGFSSVFYLIGTFWKELLVTTLSFVASHGISFFENFLGKKEYLKTDILMQMFAPYKRVITMHIAILLGSFVVIFFGQFSKAMILFVVVKVLVDFYAHKREHSLF